LPLKSLIGSLSRNFSKKLYFLSFLFGCEKQMMSKDRIKQRSFSESPSASAISAATLSQANASPQLVLQLVK